MKENRSYDQVLGDMKEGNGDASLVLFGENVTPNLHKLAREFVLLDNFYVNAESAPTAINWSTAAIAPDYVQKMWPNKYAARRTSAYDFEEQDADRRCRPPAIFGPTPPAPAFPSAISATWSNNKPNAAAGRRADHRRCATRCWPSVTNRFYRGFDLAFPTWSAPRCSSPSWRNMRSPATCRD